ncbi:MAG TPA: cytochrome c peroxidase, partial [Alphaproteobacteria bacterium]|nr:cytochrome c peroxidase [Alphaproteobacteria bacterium]
MGQGAAWRRCILCGRGVGFLLPYLLLLAMGSEGAEYKLTFPLGLQEQAAYIPEDNPLTPEKIALGKQFFWDTRWSRNGMVACVSCHDPKHGWSDPRRFSTRFDGRPTPRHSPTLVNRLFSDQQQWAGTRASLEDQAFKASDQSPELLVKNLGAIPAYQEQFRKVFGTDLNAEGVAKAIAAYERTILSGNSAYDRFLAGDQSALSPAAQRGLALFEGRARCVTCHAGFNFTDESFHNLGVGMEAKDPDLGRYGVTKDEADKGAFKTPTLRDVAQRGPYMHDGSLETLNRSTEDWHSEVLLMIPRMSVHIRVSRRPRHAKEHLRRHSPGGASPA